MDCVIDKDTWPRKEFFDFFGGISNPFYAVTFRQDVTELRDYCKERQISFYYGLIYLCCKALRDVPAFSCLPWMDVTAVTNERDLSAANAQDDSIPRICWGKFTQENGRVYLGMSVEVNHRLIDGVHIGRFAEALTRRIQELR